MHSSEDLLLDRRSARLDYSDYFYSQPTKIFCFFSELDSFLPEGSVLVVNDTKVFASRLIGQTEHGGKVEIFISEPLSGGPVRVKVLARPLRKLVVGKTILFQGGLRAVVVDGGTHRGDAEKKGFATLEFPFSASEFYAYLTREGFVPLPPYIKRNENPRASSLDGESYQTVYAQHMGSVAAPTAGLHFTEETFSLMKKKGIRIVPVTLHVGPGTFLPVREDEIEKHHMHTECYSVPAKTLAEIDQARRNKRPVVAVGTTALRSLEALKNEADRQKRSIRELCDLWHHTDLFIHPKTETDRYRPWCVDGLLTNFHQPYSTLFMLVSALIGLTEAKVLYNEAVGKRMRFHSYGDSSLLWLG